MTAPVVIYGIGELAGPFSQGFLRLGHPVYPVTRGSDPQALASRATGPALTLITVREADLDGVLESMPAPWRSTVALVQNDLVPADWERHNIDPTVAVVWFEKKPGIAPKVIRPTVVGGAGADLVVSALNEVDIPAIAAGRDDLVAALVAKNLYIGVANIAGLAIAEGATVGELWADHRDLAESVAADILEIQRALVSQDLDAGTLVADMVESFDADPEHGATGRSAPQRLERALAVAADHGLEVPALRSIRASA